MESRPFWAAFLINFVGMAILKLNPIADKVSGKLGGVIFSNTPNGTVMRSKTNVKKVPDVSSSYVKNTTAYISTLFRGLSSANLTTWQNEVPNYPYTNRVGEVSYYSAFGLFMKVNTNRVYAGLPVILSAPSFQAVQNTYFISFDSTSQGMRITIPNPDDNTLYKLYATAPISPGLKYFKKYLKQIAVIPVSSGLTRYIFTEDYLARFPVPKVGSKIGVGLKPVMDPSGNTLELSNFHTFDVANDYS